MTYKDFIDSFTSWLTAVKNAVVDPSVNRSWCTLEIEDPITQEILRNFFDRSSLNEDYVKRYNEQDVPSRQPYTYIQAEIDAIFAVHKCFVARYKNRLQYYRDDCSQKQFRIASSLQLALGKFLAEQVIAERI